MTIGIYKIINIKTGQEYVGQSNDIERRLKEHEQYKNPHTWIDRAIRSEGSDSFTCKILETFSEYDKETLDKREKYWISEGNTFINPFHYNLTPGGGGLGIQDDHPNYRVDLNDNEIIDLYVNQGFNVKEIAKKLNATQSTISKRLKDNNIRIKHGNHRELDDKLIIDLYVNQQLSTRKIAKILNTNHKIIQRHLISNNIVLRNNKRDDIPSSKKLLQEYCSSDITYAELAQKYNCSKITIARRLKKARDDINE